MRNTRLLLSVLLSLLFSLYSSVGWGQVSITTANAANTQNFDGMGTSGTATLPSGFKIGTDWSSGTTATTLAYGTTGTGVVTGTSAGGAINWANGVTGSATDRSMGFLTTGTYTSPRSIIYAFTNNTGSTVTSLNISWNYEKSRSGSRQFDWTFFHGNTSTASTANTSGDLSYSADANNTVISNPPAQTSKSFTISGLSIANGTTYYIRWTYTGLAGSTNSQGLSIDDFSITLVAVTSHTVTFNKNDGTGTTTTQTSSSSANLTSNSFTRTGYTYTGWYTTANGSGGTAYADGASYSFAADVILYAQWTANSNTITFDGNTNTGGSTTSQNINTDASANLTANGFTKTGYTFAGWATSAGGAVAYVNQANYTMGTGNVTLYAKWTANSNTITFDGNGFDGGSTATQNINTDASANLTANGFTRTGYAFNGWNTAANGSGTAYANQASYSMGTSGVTLYAQWTLITSPTISGAATATAFTSTYGTASSAQSFGVSGSNLTEAIVATAPTGVQVSRDGGTTYQDTVWFDQSSGAASGTLKIRLKATAAVTGSYNSQNIALTSAGATTVNITTAASGNAVTAKALTITGLSATAKTYTATTTVSITGTPAYSGLENGESFSIVGSPTWAFTTKTVGTAKAITQSGSYSAPSSNYSITQPTLTADITAATLTITSPTATNRDYDGTTNVTVGGTLSGVLLSDVVTMSTTGTITTAGIGSGKTVTFSVSGSDATNYSLTQPGTTVNISAKALSVSSAAAANKAYDGTNTATITGSLVGVVSPDVVTLTGTGTFASSNPGTGIAVTSTSTLGGADAGNYSLTQPTGLTANITVQSPGLLLSEENFTATSGVLTSNGWTQISSTSTNPISTGSGNGLSYSSYGSTNIGNAAIMVNTGQDVYKTVTSQNPGAGSATVYYSALVNFSAIQTGDYFLTLGESSTFASSAIYRARLYAKKGSTTSKILFGISTNGTVTYGATEYDISTTYLVVVKHVFTTSTSTSSLFINPSVTTEPASAYVTDATASTVSTGLDAIVLRQGATSSAPSVLVDGIRIASDWGTLLGNPMYTSTSNIATGNYNNVTVYSGTTSLTGNVSINGSLSNSSELSLGANTLTLTGAVTGSGTLSSTSSSNIAINGSAGTINFTGGSNTLHNLTLGSSATATLGSDLNITAGATSGSVTIGSGATLTTGGHLILKSDASGTAKIAQSAGTVSGNVTVERYIPAKASRKYSFLASPVTQSVANSWQTQIHVTGPGTGGTTCQSGSSGSQPTTNSNGFDASGTNAPTMFYYDQTTTPKWNSIANTSVNLTPGTGYRVLVRGTRAQGCALLFTNPPTPNAVTLSATGTVAQGTFTVPVSGVNNGFTLLGNPYPADLNFTQFQSDNSGVIANKFWAYSPEKGAGVYATYVPSVGNANFSTGYANHQIIASGQAFFVENNSTSNTVSFNEAQKAGTQQTGMFKNGADLDRIRVSLYDTSSATNSIDEALIDYSANGSLTYTQDYDARSMNSGKMVATMKATDKMAIQSRPTMTPASNDTVALFVDGTTANYSLGFTEHTNFIGDVYLLDKFNNTLQDIKATPNYAFAITADTNTKGANRFALVFKALPCKVKIKTVGGSTVCEPNAVQFVIDSNAAAYTNADLQWNLDGAPIAGETNDTYSINAASGGNVSLTISWTGCNKTSNNKSFIVKPQPTAAFIASGATTFCAGGSVTLTAPTISGYSYTWYNNGTSIGSGASKIIKTAGDYTVVAKLNGCLSTPSNTATVQVNPLPIASIAATTPTTFCAGDICTMNATPTGGTNYSWINGAITENTGSSATFTTNVAGKFKVMVTDNNGCVSKTSASSITTKVNPIPTATINAMSSTTISSTGNVKLNAMPSSGVSWQWYKDGTPIANATTKQYIATTGGNYSVAVTKTGCTGTSIPTVVTQTTSKQEIGTTNGSFVISAYPNPVSDVLTVDVSGIQNPTNPTVEIMNSMGQQVAVKALSSTVNCELSTTNWSSGIYFVRYKDDEGRTGTIKIIKD